MIDKNSKRNSKTDRPKTVVSNNYHSFFECLELSQLAGVFNDTLNVINFIEPNSSPPASDIQRGDINV